MTSGTAQDASFDVSWAIGVCFYHYFLLFITNYTIFQYCMTMKMKISDIGGCGQRVTSGMTQDMSFDVYWAIGMFLLSLLAFEGHRFAWQVRVLSFFFFSKRLP